jgi:hypothetical protein
MIHVCNSTYEESSEFSKIRGKNLNWKQSSFHHAMEHSIYLTRQSPLWDLRLGYTLKNVARYVELLNVMTLTDFKRFERKELFEIYQGFGHRSQSFKIWIKTKTKEENLLSMMQEQFHSTTHNSKFKTVFTYTNVSNTIVHLYRRNLPASFQISSHGTCQYPGSQPSGTSSLLFLTSSLPALPMTICLTRLCSLNHY